MRLRSVPIVGSIAACCLLFGAPPVRGQYVFDAGGGFEIPIDADQRDDFGAASAMHLGAAAALGAGRTLVFVEVGRIHSEGEIFPADPTFEMDEAELRLVPISLGIRTDFVKPSPEGRVSLYGGMAWQTVLARYEDAAGHSESVPTLGIAFDLRPEIRVGSHWGVWVRQRFAFLGDTDFGDAAGSFDLSGSQISAGLSWRVQ